MLLTEAVHIVSMMPREAYIRASYSATSDPMVREVCRWRRASHRKFDELAGLVGVGRRCRTNDLRSSCDHETTKACVLRVVKEAATPLPVLARRCRCSPHTVTATIHRLRNAGHPIEWARSMRGSAGGYMITNGTRMEGRSGE